MADPVIESMRIEDYAEIRALWMATPGVGLTGADSLEGISAYLLRNPGSSFQAKLDGRIIAAVLGGHDGRRGFIHHLCVAPDFRSQGLGRKLLESVLCALHREGVQKCHVMVFANNESGLNFWRHIAWTLRDDLCLMSIATA